MRILCLAGLMFSKPRMWIKFIRGDRLTGNMARIMTAVCVLLQCGCASTPASIAPARVAVEPYLQMDCVSLTAERSRVEASLKDAATVQAEQSDHDAATVAAALIIVTPIVVAIRGNGSMAAEVARLKGERIAVDTAIAGKRCPKQRPPSPYQSPVNE